MEPIPKQTQAHRRLATEPGTAPGGSDVLQALAGEEGWAASSRREALQATEKMIDIDLAEDDNDIGFLEVPEHARTLRAAEAASSARDGFGEFAGAIAGREGAAADGGPRHGAHSCRSSARPQGGAQTPRASSSSDPS